MQLCKTGSQLACVAAITPTEFCCSYRCAVTHHQCTARLRWAKSTPHCSVLLFQRRLTAAMSHGNSTYDNLLTMQVCSHPTPKRCSTALSKMLFPLYSAALQNSLTAALCQCNYTYEILAFIQVCSDPTPMHCNTGFGEGTLHCSGLLCRTGSQHICVTALTPTEICSSYRCAVTHHQCTATLPWAKCTPHCSVLLFQKRLTAALSHGNYTYADLLFIQVCSEPTEMHCIIGLGKMPSPLFSAAL